MTYAISKNTQFNSIEVSFDGKPSEAVRQALKDLKFRWHSVKKVWYGYSEEETVKAAIDGKPVAKKASAPKATKKAETVNKFGVKVGDLFSASWGYEQTQCDFFQVIALVGETSVRVREVNPPMISDEATGPMAADRVYQTKGLPILPARDFSVFIKDQEKGDIKRLKSYRQDGTEPQFYLSSFANAYYCSGDTHKAYESWYY